jgi:hypothetical protein
VIAIIPPGYANTAAWSGVNRKRVFLDQRIFDAETPFEE